jgi:hypothetical protein
MAAREVIYFPFGAQLSTRPQCPALLPPEPVAESPSIQAIEKRTHCSRVDYGCARTPNPAKSPKNCGQRLESIEECRR